MQNFSHKIVSQVGTLDGCKFSLMTDDAIFDESVVQLTSSKQMSNSMPHPAGMYDARMGAQFKYNCATCGNNVNLCVGHRGHINLPIPSPEPLHIDTVHKFFRFSCGRCNRIMFDVDIRREAFETFMRDHQHNWFSGVQKFLDELYTKAKTACNIYCDHCEGIKEKGVQAAKHYVPKHPLPSYVANKFSVFVDKMIPKDGKYVYKRTVFIDEIYNRLYAIPDSELSKLGISPLSHPKHMIRTRLAIPGTTERTINNFQSHGSGDNNTTKKFANIFDVAESIAQFRGTPIRHMDDDQLKLVKRMISEHFAMVGVNLPGSSTEIECDDGEFANLKGKDGFISMRITSRIVSKMGRHVIVNSAERATNEVCISRNMAKAIRIHETVTQYNFVEMAKLVKNGENYPGAPSVIKKGDQPRLNRGDMEIDVGDVVVRHVITGDKCTMHRAPTMVPPSISSMNVVVNDADDDIYTVKISETACSPYGADFDGDEMTQKFFNDAATRFEQGYLGDVTRYTNESSSSKPYIGEIQDGIHGLALLTMTGFKVSRIEAERLLRGTGISIEWGNREFVTGRELFSMTLPKINYTTKSPCVAKKQVEMSTLFHPDDKQVVIENGVLKTGIICGDIVKTLKNNNIYNYVLAAYGKKEAYDMLNKHRRLAFNTLKLVMLSCSHADLREHPQTKMLTQIVKTAKLVELDALNHKIITNKLETPEGVSPADFVESERMRITNVGDMYLTALLANPDLRNNALVMACILGVEGSLGNIYQICSDPGPTLIGGRIAKPKFDYFRTSAYYPTFAMSPESFGWCSSPIKDGFQPSDAFHRGMVVRNAMFEKSVGTAEGGTLNKDVVKTEGSAVVDHRRFSSRGLGQTILEFNNGGCGFSPNHNYANKYVAFGVTDFSVYGDNAKLVAAEKRELVLEAVRVQNLFIGYSFGETIHLPIIIDAICRPTSDQKGNSKENFAILNKFLDDVVYIRVNRRQREAQMPVPQIMGLPFNVLRIMIRAYFTKAVIEQYSADGLLQCLGMLKYHIHRTMWTPGDVIGSILAFAFTSPITQFLIDSHHNINGVSPNEMLAKTMNDLNGKDETSHVIKQMYIYLRPELETTEANAKTLAEYVVGKKLINLLYCHMLIYEYIDENITFPKDAEPFANALKQMNYRFSRENIQPIKMRLVLKKSEIKKATVNMVDIVTKLDTMYSGLHSVYYDDPNNAELTVLMLFASTTFSWTYTPVKSKEVKGGIQRIASEFVNKLCTSFVINEFTNIESAEIRSKRVATLVDTNIVYKTIYYVQTRGINLEEVLCIDQVDPNRTTTSNINLTYRTEGLNAGFNKVVLELDRVFSDGLGYHPACYYMLAATMFEKGFLTPMNQKGHTIREPHDYLTSIVIRDPKKGIIKATTNSVDVALETPMANHICGQVGRFGSNFSQVKLNEEFHFANSKKATSVEDLF